MDGGFYRALEDRYRGSRELITQRLEAYLPFLAPLQTLYQDYPVLDLGCGRGEWLELLTREGYSPAGVDLDDGMLEACDELGLPVRKIDALQALQELPANSLVAVTGFHIAEHVPFSVLQELVIEALRVLRPAGLLILETPNVESLVVGTNSFYLDPTHERPLPSLLLSFLTEHSGFARSKIVRLQEAPELLNETTHLGLLNVLTGTSPDYSVVAQKQAQAEMLVEFQAVFHAAYGVSLDQLATRYDRALEHRLTTIEDEMATARAELMTRESFSEAIESVHRQHTQQLLLIQERQSADLEVLRKQALEQRERYKTELDELSKYADELQERCKLLERDHQNALAHNEAVQTDLNSSLGNAHTWYLRAIAYEQQLEAVLRSNSWRLTQPLRLFAKAIYRGAHRGRSLLVRSIPHARLWLARRPAIQRFVRAVLRRSPWLLGKLHNLHQSTQHPDPMVPEHAVGAVDSLHGVIDHAPLTPRGRAIKGALQEAMMKGQN